MRAFSRTLSESVSAHFLDNGCTKEVTALHLDPLQVAHKGQAQWHADTQADRVIRALCDFVGLQLHDFSMSEVNYGHCTIKPVQR